MYSRTINEKILPSDRFELLRQLAVFNLQLQPLETLTLDDLDRFGEKYGLNSYQVLDLMYEDEGFRLFSIKKTIAFILTGKCSNNIK